MSQRTRWCKVVTQLSTVHSRQPIGLKTISVFLSFVRNSLASVQASIKVDRLLKVVQPLLEGLKEPDRTPVVSLATLIRISQRASMLIMGPNSTWMEVEIWVTDCRICVLPRVTTLTRASRVSLATLPMTTTPSTQTRARTIGMPCSTFSLSSSSKTSRILPKTLIRSVLSAIHTRSTNILPIRAVRYWIRTLISQLWIAVTRINRAISRSWTTSTSR